jgi:hypothetical protein
LFCSQVSLTISILLSLTFFLLVLIEMIPSTSLALPLLGKYLMFTLLLVFLSIVVTIFVLNIHFRSPATHHMSACTRRLFLHVLPRWLRMHPPQAINRITGELIARQLRINSAVD